MMTGIFQMYSSNKEIQEIMDECDKLKKKLKKTKVNIHAEKYAYRIIGDLQKATPKNTGNLVEAWKVEYTTEDGFSISNSYIPEGAYTPLWILLEYGHYDKSGVYHQPLVFVRPILEKYEQLLRTDINLVLEKI